MILSNFRFHPRIKGPISFAAMRFKIYEYKKCETCRKALKFVREKGVAFESIPIREQPPTEDELRQMLTAYNGDIKKLFNTSGVDYKQLNLKEALPKMTVPQAIALLSKNGNLVKRPFMLSESSGVVGFRQEEWEKILKS